MRIIHIITRSVLGGAQSVVTSLANQQCNDNEVYIISGTDGNAWDTLDPKIQTIGIKQLKRSISPLDIIVIFKLLYYRFRLRADVIHLHSSKIGILGRLCFPRKKIIYTVHGFDTIRVANKTFLWLEKLLKRQAAQIVAVSQYDLKNLKKNNIKSNTCCIYNGIEDTTKSNNNISEQIEQKIQNIRAKFQHIVLCIARTEYPKRLDIFLDTARKMPACAFIWIGNNQENYPELPDNVFLLGSVPNASLYIRYIDVFILPTDFEGLPISIIEALSYGKPIVASNVGGISELLANENGFTVENYSEQFVQRLVQLFSDDQLYSKLSVQARQTYENKFTVSLMVNSYYILYQRISSITKIANQHN